MTQKDYFVALYEGRTVSTARIVGATAQATIVQQVAAALLETEPVDDPITEGRRNALRLVSSKEADRDES